VVPALIVATLVTFAAIAPAAPPGERHVVIISLDGLRPEFYLDDAYAAPTLRALARAGAHARAAEPVFPSITYPNHASIVTGVRPARHGVLFNVLFDVGGERGRWYEEAADLRAPPIWEWARAAGLTTAAVSWPSTFGARIDVLLPERDYYARREPLGLLLQAATPGLFDRLGVTPRPEMFRDIIQWDAFLTATAAAIIRDARPHLLLLHLVQLDYFQHRVGRDGPEVKRALARVDAHVGTLRATLVEAGIAPQAVLIVTGDHGFQNVTRLVFPNEVLAQAGLRRCPQAGEGWRATVHVAGGAAAVFVNPPGDGALLAQVEDVLRREAGGRYTVLTRGELDGLGAMTGAALGIEASPGFMIGGTCGRGLEAGIGTIYPGTGTGGAHGYLPSRASMATGFIAAGAGVRAGVALERVRLIDIAPTAARLLGVTPPPVEGRVIGEILP
jgi:predicted AlkP superfamily pyrophosphatase or phosphodiesterase